MAIVCIVYDVIFFILTHFRCNSSLCTLVTDILYFPYSFADHSISKLVEMGFSAEAAAQALRTTGGRLEKAIFALLAPQPPNAPADPPQSRVVLWLRSLVDQLTPRVSNISVSVSSFPFLIDYMFSLFASCITLFFCVFSSTRTSRCVLLTIAWMRMFRWRRLPSQVGFFVFQSWDF